jgi:uncharacterized membrane protein
MKNPLLKKIIFFCGLFLFPLLLRLPGIAFHSLWFDETSTALCISQNSYSGVVKAVNTFESLPPLFFLIEKAFLTTFQVTLDEFSLRFFPVVCGVFVCVVYFIIFKQVAPTKTALGAFFLVSCAQFLINSSQDARPYSLFCLMSLVTLSFTLLWWKDPDRKNLAALAVSTVLLIQTHYYAPLWLVALAAAVIFVKRDRVRIKTYLVTLLLSGGASFLLLISFFITQMQYQFSGEKDYLLAKWVPGILYSPVKVLLGSYLFKIERLSDLHLFDILGIILALVIIVAAAWCCVIRLRRKEVTDAEKIITFSLLFCFCVHVMIGWKVPTIHPRYMEYFLVLLFGVLLINTGYRKKLQIAVFITLVGLNVVANGRYYLSPIPYMVPWKNVAHTVDSCAQVKGFASKPVLAAYAYCLSIGFYSERNEITLAQMYPFKDISDTFSLARLDLFGHPFFTSLYHYRFFPASGTMSMIEILKSKGQGLFVDKTLLSIEDYQKQLIRRYGKLITFALEHSFDSNQGHVVIMQWQYRGGYSSYGQSNVKCTR